MAVVTEPAAETMAGAAMASNDQCLHGNWKGSSVDHAVALTLRMCSCLYLYTLRLVSGPFAQALNPRCR